VRVTSIAVRSPARRTPAASWFAVAAKQVHLERLEIENRNQVNQPLDMEAVDSRHSGSSVTSESGTIITIGQDSGLRNRRIPE
jgi:hypothetical protein